MGQKPNFIYEKSPTTSCRLPLLLRTKTCLSPLHDPSFLTCENKEEKICCDPYPCLVIINASENALRHFFVLSRGCPKSILPKTNAIQVGKKGVRCDERMVVHRYTRVRPILCSVVWCGVRYMCRPRALTVFRESRFQERGRVSNDDRPSSMRTK